MYDKRLAKIAKSGKANMPRPHGRLAKLDAKVGHRHHGGTHWINRHTGHDPMRRAR
jgi:flavin reductase (DIM6/NTAB) family NADH-FMN oxidoreductase RutF